MTPDVTVSTNTRIALRKGFIFVLGSIRCGPPERLYQSCNARRLPSAIMAGLPARVLSRAARAKVAELVDALDLGSSGVTRAGSSPAFRIFYEALERPAQARKRVEDLSCKY